MSRLLQILKNSPFYPFTWTLRSRSAMHPQNPTLLGEEMQPLITRKKDTTPQKEKRTCQTYTLAILTMMSEPPNPWMAGGNQGFFY